MFSIVCLGIWKDWQPEVENTNNSTEIEDGGDAETVDGSSSSTAGSTAIDDLASRKKVVVTNLSTTFTSFHAQEVADGSKIEDLLTRLREEAANNPPLGGYHPKKGDLAMARFSEDGQWYRVKIDKTMNPNETQVLYIDYGNREVLKNKDIAPLPLGFSSQPPGAREYQFAFVFPDTDQDFVDEIRQEFMAETEGRVLLLKTEYKDPNTNLDAVTLFDEVTKNDVILKLVTDGWLFVDTKTRRSGRLFKKWVEYKNAQESAKKNGVSFLLSNFKIVIQLCF